MKTSAGGQRTPVSAYSCMIGGAPARVLQCVIASTCRLHSSAPSAPASVTRGMHMWATHTPATGTVLPQALPALFHTLPSAIRRPTLLQREVPQLQDLRHWHAEHGRQPLRQLSSCSAAVASAPCETAEQAQVNLRACVPVTVVRM